MADPTKEEQEKSEKVRKFLEEFEDDERLDWCCSVLENEKTGSWTREVSIEEIRHALSAYLVTVEEFFRLVDDELKWRKEE